MDYAQIQAALADRNLKRVAEATGIHHNTLVRLRKGYVKTRASTLATLREYLTR